jgi:hypothetical protein
LFPFSLRRVRLAGCWPASMLSAEVGECGKKLFVIIAIEYVQIFLSKTPFI